jgi:hypothetical protein
MHKTAIAQIMQSALALTENYPALDNECNGDFAPLTVRTKFRVTRQQNFLIRSAASNGLLNPLRPPGPRLEGISEILGFVDHLAVAELHNTHRVCESPLARDCVFRDPEDPRFREAGRLAGMMDCKYLHIDKPAAKIASLLRQ